MQGHQVSSMSRVHPTLEIRHSTLSRGTIEDITMDQVDLAQASNLYARQRTDEKQLTRESQSHTMLQTRLSGLSEMQGPYPAVRSRTSRSVWYDDQGERRNKYLEQLRLQIRQHFHQKECRLFVPALNQKVKKVRELKCHCGEVLMEHAGMRNGDQNTPAKVGNLFVESLYLIPKELRPYISSHKLDEEPSLRMPELRWNKENIRTTVTSTYGKINFVNVEHHGGKKPAKYLRISDEDSVDDLMELMMDQWKIMEPQAPNLVISVVGGAKNFKLDGRMRDTFSTGLIKTAKTTSAWLITSGFNMGVMKAVGQAVRQGQSFCWDNERMAHVLRCIGIAPWGYVMDRKKLESEDGQGSFNVDFRMSNAILHGQPVPLNADHTHFIFVDDGYRNRYGGVAGVRSKFEQKVFKNTKDGGLGIPVVLVVVEGGTDAISDAKSSLQHDIPVVICSGTGRAADIIAYAYSHTKAVSGGAKEMTQRHLAKLREKIFDAYGKSWKENEKENKLDGIQEMVLTCCEKPHLITVFNMNKQEDLDLAILSALLKSTTGASEDQRLKQLKLALTWNRVDIAQEEIFREDVLWKPQSLYETVVDAILTNKIKFIELIMQQGSVIMKEFLTASRLQELYMKVPKYSFLYRLMFKLTGKDELTLDNVDQLLFKLLDRFAEDDGNKIAVDQYYDENDDNMCELDMTGDIIFIRPYKKLMIWAILMHRQELAKFCWEMGDEPVTSGIAATRLYDAIAKHIGRNESELRDSVYSYKDEFEDLATGVLNECHQRDPEKAMMIVERRSPAWNEMTCLQIAAASNAQMFIASETCLNSVNTIWRSGILSRWFKIILCVICPLYVIFSMDFVIGKKNLTWYEKLGTFFTAPTTKFFYRMILYIVFMCLHSYMVLVDFEAARITPLEIVCTIWIVSFIIDKIHTVIAFPSLTLRSKFRDFVGFMDMIELLNYVMCIIGFICHVASFPRVTKVFYCVNAAFFIINLTKYYTASPVLGPKLNMITKMMKELFMFLIVLVVFLLAYGISSQGLLYKEREPDWVILKDIVYFPYWQLYGELFLEEIDSAECTAGSMNCRTFHWLVPILLGVYLLVGNILLLTLLIAIFSNVFDNVEQNAQTISKYYMYFLVVEHDVKVFLAPPLSLIQHLYLVFVWLFRHTCCKKDKEKQTLGKRHLEYLQLFEKENMTNMLRQRKENELVRLEITVASLQKRVDDLTKLIEDEVIADAQSGGQTAMPFGLTSSTGQRESTGMMESRQQSFTSLTPNSGQSWPKPTEVINVKDKVINTSIPSDYFRQSIPKLERTDSAALLVLPSEAGSKSLMTIPVTLTGEKSGDTTKIMVQELRSSRKGEGELKLEGIPEDVRNESLTKDKGEVKNDEEVKDKELSTLNNTETKQDTDIVTAEVEAETGAKVKRRSSSKKRKRDREGRTDDHLVGGVVNNVNRPHSSVDRADHRVHFLLPGDNPDVTSTRPKTAGYAEQRTPEIVDTPEPYKRPGTSFDRYQHADLNSGKGKVEITDLNDMYGQIYDSPPQSAWDEIESPVHLTVKREQEHIVKPVTGEEGETSGDKKKKKKKKKKKRKHNQDEQESSA